MPPKPPHHYRPPQVGVVDNDVVDVVVDDALVSGFFYVVFAFVDVIFEFRRPPPSLRHEIL